MSKLRKIIILLLLVNSFAVFSQDDVFSARIYPTEGELYYIYSDVANIRSGAGLNFDQVDKLFCGDEITLTEYDRNGSDVINQLGAGWVKVSYRKENETKEGYLWELNLSKTQLRRGDLKFVFGIEKVKPKDENYIYVLQVKVVRNNQIISRVEFETRTTPLISGNIIDNGGLVGVEKIIKIYLSGEACGEPMIDAYLAWTGKDLKYMIQTVSAGDILEGRIENLILPATYDSGESNVVIKLVDDFERNETEDGNGDLPEADHDYKTEIYIWDGNKLTLQEQKNTNK